MATRIFLSTFVAAALLTSTGCWHEELGEVPHRPPPGGPPASPGPASIDDTSWLIFAVDGDRTPLTGDILRDDLYAIDFSGGGLMGYGGCNRFSGRYTHQGDVLTVSLHGSTRRGCAPSVMAREYRLFQILARPVRVTWPDWRTMLLENEVGQISLVRSDGPE